MLLTSLMLGEKHCSTNSCADVAGLHVVHTCSSMWRLPSTGSGVLGGGTVCFSLMDFLLQMATQ